LGKFGRTSSGTFGDPADLALREPSHCSVAELMDLSGAWL
jgi:hypothetical protein